VEGRAEAVKDCAPVPITTSVALVHDDQIEIVRGVLLEYTQSALRFRIQRLVDREMNISLERHLSAGNDAASISETGEFVVRLISEGDSVRDEENPF